MLQPQQLLVTRSMASKMLGCSIKTLKQLEAEGRLTPLRLGLRTITYRVPQVHKLVEGLEESKLPMPKELKDAARKSKARRRPR